MARPPQCGYSLDGQDCTERGPHYCIPRVERVVGFFHEVLVHTKGRWARRPFILAPWQRDDIIEPVFGPVVWSEEWECYRRLVTQLDIEIARKNGKSEIDAGVALLLTCADDEESAEVYGCARDRDQARKVYDVAERMVELSPVLSKRLTVKSSAKRIIDERTASYYEVIAADAAGNLGHNPHGVVLDEVITQRDGTLWEALSTAEGTRVQPLFVRSTTAGNDPSSWAATEHAENERAAEDPERAPHRHVLLRNTPKDADPWDEDNWPYANPALGDFLSIEVLRRAATDARNDPTKENAFRQFRLCQWVSQVTRWIPLHLWDACGADLLSDIEERTKGEACYAGLDLSSKLDLTSWCLWFPDSGDVLWRFWVPEEQIPYLDKHTGDQASQWVKQGLLFTTEGNWIDYEGAVHPQIEKDNRSFRIIKAGYDEKYAEATAQFMQRLEMDVHHVPQGYALSGALGELMALIQARRIHHGANPVARWNADSAEVRSPQGEEAIKIEKPIRHSSGKRIDGVAALAFALWMWQHADEEAPEPFAFVG